MLLVIAISFLCCGTLAQDEASNSTARGAKGEFETKQMHIRYTDPN